MKQTVIYVGLDVDDTHYHGPAGSDIGSGPLKTVGPHQY
jgi:hypothetical protein